MSKHLSYDKEHDIFSVHLGFSSDEHFKGNIDAGDLILDISTAGRVCGIEIMNASEFLREFSINLNEVTDATFNATMRPNGVMVGMLFKAQGKEISAKVAVPIEI